MITCFGFYNDDSNLCWECEVGDCCLVENVRRLASKTQEEPVYNKILYGGNSA